MRSGNVANDSGGSTGIGTTIVAMYTEASPATSIAASVSTDREWTAVRMP